jgi:hypothetical protein
MSVSSKANRLAELAEQLLLDNDLRARTVQFCRGVRPLLEQRNRTVHSLYGVVDDGILQFSFPRQEKMRTVEATELFELANQIWDFLDQAKKLEDDVRQHRENVRIAVMQMAKESPP